MLFVKMLFVIGFGPYQVLMMERSRVQFQW